MSGSASLNLERSLLDHTLAITPMPALSRVYIALCHALSAPTEATTGAEVSGGGYARVPATFARVASPPTVAVNTAAVEFPAATAAWGTLGYFEIWTAQTGGSRQYWGPLVDPADSTVPLTLNVAAGDIARFSAGTLVVQAAELAVTIGGTSWLINVRDYGAQGDGTTDDSAAIQAAVNALPAGGGAVYFPKGIYLVSSTTYVTSNTRLFGDGAASLFKAAYSWTGTTAATGETPNLAFIQNLNASTPVANGWAYTDHDIIIEKLAFDYTGMALVNASCKCVIMQRVKRLMIRDCVFNVAGAQNATALLACDETTTENCHAYEFRNCAYDHWVGPKRAIVSNCFAQTSNAVQFVNWNPEANFNGLRADTLLVSGCQFENTNATVAASLMLEVLTSGVGNSVRNVTVVDNVLHNIVVAIRGDTANVVISGNTFIDPLGNTETVLSYARADGIKPDNITVANNIIANPLTVPANVAVIRVEATNSVIVGNRISGAGYTAEGIHTSGNAIVSGNAVSGGIINVLSPGVTHNVNSIVPNGGAHGWYDSAGSLVRWVLQSDNNHLFYGTNASGGQRAIMQIQQRADSSALQFLPNVLVASSNANYFTLSGAVAGSAPQFLVQGADSNIAMQLVTKGNSAVRFQRGTGAVAPVAADLPANFAAVWKNTTDSSVRLYYNDGGTMKSVALT